MTVVSNVFGKQFSNSHLISSSFINFFVSIIVASTESLINFRSAISGRLVSKVMGANDFVKDRFEKDNPAIARLPVFIKDLLDGT